MPSPSASPPPPPPRPRPGFTLPDADRWIPGLAAISLLFANLIDATSRFLWVDEILTATLVADRSIVHMLRALADQVDTSPPLYYIVAWIWARAFGNGAVSLRLLSAIFASIAFALVWRLLRPYASLGVRAAIVCSCVLLPRVMLLQIAEARSYGLLMALAALTLVDVDVLSRMERPRVAVLVGVAATQGALALAHTLGIMFSVAALAALVVSDMIRGRRRWIVYVAWMAGWIAFVPWLPALRWQMQVGVPRFPIPPATGGLLVDGLTLGLPARVGFLVAFLVVLAVLVAWRSIPAATLPESSRPDSPPDALPIALAAASWIAAAFALWIFSRIARPLFLPRYLVPLALAYAVVGTLGVQAAIDRLVAFARATPVAAQHGPPAGSHYWILAAVTAIALFEPVSRADHAPPSNRPGGDSLEVLHDLPIATISTHTYLPRVFYAARPDRYVFILDWKSALLPDAPVGPTEYKLMAAMGRNYPDHWVEDGEHFLATHSRFLVVDEAGLFWFKRRVQPSPDFTVSLLYDKLLCGSGLPEDRCPVYLVERKSTASLSSTH